ncbi:HAMP domain-containing protein [Acetobacterium fimetarium]|uniref:HAMP domain-containing protein n=1 Tax=Acetobacterium fimetarium TaxID=52691 RepID=A0ABR6WS12_9FIRM|nr:methyl-accepting chemotaxis protein [Acetobacterium fimetarium]MBC3803327.1 HAMP domain-containing protein [Acetobacterium fimetarium]
MKFKNKIVVLFVTAIVLINLGIGIYAVNSMQNKVLDAARAKLLSDAALGGAFLDQQIPGEWIIKEGDLYKGTVRMNDNFDVVDKIGALTGDTVTVFQGDTRVATNVKDAEGNRAVNTQATDVVKQTVLDQGESYIGKANVVGVWNQTVYQPITSAKGEVIGIWYVGIPNTTYDQLAADFRNMLILFSIVAVALAGIVIWFMTNRMTRPLVMLEKVTNKVAQGDLTQQVAAVKSKDEIAALTVALARMIENMRSALQKIAASSDAVAMGAQNISTASASLSVGGTEQASSIEELTASIKQIDEQITINGESVSEAVELVGDAQAKVNNGDQEMHKMLACMDDIDESSQNIGNIIKVIDEIAFQTNVLALNAGVEAAKAGEYGKGFAVVAEEVRNLSIRTTAAVKQTSSLIEASGKNVKLGIDVANRMSAALEEIKTSIKAVESRIAAVGLASAQQTQSIHEINSGISTIANVVHTNSATAEETAAASEVLFSQAEILEKQTNQFKLH